MPGSVRTHWKSHRTVTEQQDYNWWESSFEHHPLTCREFQHASGLKHKDLMMMPARVAMALQADGWWLRSEIVWHKPNPMPESVTDRPTSAHEKMFLLSKSAKYFYDAEAVRLSGKSWVGGGDRGQKGARPPGRGPDSSLSGMPGSGANLRNVWKIATHSFSEAHFATFPPKLVEPCLKSGTSEKGCCCGVRCAVGENGEHTKDS